MPGMHPDHRTLRWLVLFGYVLVAAGVPLPVGSVAAGASRSPEAAKRLAAKDRSVPFPCMDSPCGCVTAQQCFESCCCHTPAELLAWATARNLSVDVLQGLERRLQKAPPAVASSCCGEASPEPASCCEAATASYCDEAAPVCCDELASCCDEAAVAGDAGHACCDDHAVPATAEVAPLSESVVVLQAMLACGGVVSEWLACAAAPLPVVLAVSPLERRRETVGPSDDAAICVCFLLDPPPPRVG